MLTECLGDYLIQRVRLRHAGIFTSLDARGRGIRIRRLNCLRSACGRDTHALAAFRAMLTD